MGGNRLQGRAANLEELVRARFGNLSAAELKLVRVVPKGDFAYCGPSQRDDDPGNDPSQADHWRPERQIRAELIRWLCIDWRGKDHVDPKGIQVHAARVTGELNLSYGLIPFPLTLWRSALTHDASLVSVEILELIFDGSWVQALNFERARVTGSVFLRNGFRAQGIVRLLNTQIGGNLECDRGAFINPPKKNFPGSGIALYADGISIEGSVFLRNGFRAEGEVRLLGAQIGGTLECQDGAFINPLKKKPDGSTLEASGWALSANRARVKGKVFLSDSFEAEGTIDLRGARTEDALNCLKGIFKAATLDLRDASAHSIMDDDKSWPNQGNLYLDGLVYERISEGPTEARTRLRWLELQSEFTPQPSRQLAKVLMETGDDRGAHWVLFQMERRRRAQEMERFRRVHQDHGLLVRLRCAIWSRAVSLWNGLVALTIGYGYYPGWAFVWLLLLAALGWGVFRLGYAAGAMAPTDKDAYSFFVEQCRKQHCQPPEYYERFHAFVYSLENSVPLVKLGPEEKWQPDPVGPVMWPGFLRWFRWGQICFGWFLTTLFVAGVSGIVRRQ